MAGQCRAGLAKHVLGLWGGGVGDGGGRGCQRARGGKVQEGDTVQGARLLASSGAWHHHRMQAFRHG